jgi:hypothetical protein
VVVVPAAGSVVPSVGSVTAGVVVPSVVVAVVVVDASVVVDPSVAVEPPVCDVWLLVSGGAAAVGVVLVPPESSAAAGPATARAAATQHTSTSRITAPCGRPSLVPTFSPTKPSVDPLPESLFIRRRGRTQPRPCPRALRVGAYGRGGKTILR